ncbi:LOW QUALITY PROTEIN: protein LSM12-like [Centruroides vittatus]|uniref:protein LSM12 homolog n=1 Tax=Centruroides sculpturatus TaxID=218467 RepID=UPI000C6D4AD1|nr:protein LSM12 homolog [Centruroides sculpturatus]
MKVKMATTDENEDFTLFTVGSIVRCKTCHQQTVEGEVVAFDYQTKMLILKCPSSNGKANNNDIHMINLDFVEDVEVKKEISSTPPALQSLNLDKLNSRAKQNIKERQCLVTAISSGVSQEGMKLFVAITKTISEVSWQGKNIVVMNQVTITPPYRPENCKGKTEGEALNHVRKIVEKHLKDQQMQQQSRSQIAQS